MPCKSGTCHRTGSSMCSEECVERWPELVRVSQPFKISLVGQCLYVSTRPGTLCKEIKNKTSPLSNRVFIPVYLYCIAPQSVARLHNCEHMGSWHSRVADYVMFDYTCSTETCTASPGCVIKTAGNSDTFVHVCVRKQAAEVCGHEE
jgi:hypothetical protein